MPKIALTFGKKKIMNRNINENVFKACMAELLDNLNDLYEQDTRSEFFDGKFLAYYEVFSTLQGEIEGFGIDLKEVGLDFDVDKITSYRKE